MEKGIIAAVIMMAALSMARAHKGEGHDKDGDKDKREIVKVVKKIATAWSKADGKVFRKYYDPAPTVRIVESGGQNAGVEDLIEHHVLPERDHFKVMKVVISAVEVNLSEDRKSAWSISDIEFKAETKDGKKIHSKGFETAIWAKHEGKWRILHSHSSTRKVRPKSKAKH